MNRLKQVQEFIDFDLNNNFTIEPKNRHEAVKERLFDIINMYNPRVIIKAGLGHGDILQEIVKTFKSHIIVVEPSISAINNFIKNTADDSDAQKIKFINGDFCDFPVDYYAADLIICIDYLDFFDSSKCIDEFKRALQFDGIFFFATVALNADDIDGVYDDFMKIIFPLHNDYYIPEDITTFLELKEFKLIKNINLKFDTNLYSKIEYFRKYYNSSAEENAVEYIKSHKEDFKNFLKIDENNNISEPYYLGVYMRKKDDSL